MLGRKSARGPQKENQVPGRQISWPGSLREDRLEATAGYESALACVERLPLCQPLVCVSLSEHRAGGGQKSLLPRKRIRRDPAGGDGPCFPIFFSPSVPISCSASTAVPAAGLLSPPAHGLHPLLLRGGPSETRTWTLLEWEDSSEAASLDLGQSRADSGCLLGD